MCVCCVRFLGLSVGLIQAGMNYTERREAYQCDITYVTNVELGRHQHRFHSLIYALPNSLSVTNPLARHGTWARWRPFSLSRCVLIARL